MKNRALHAVLLVCGLFLSAFTFGQKVTGDVKDPAGLPLPGLTVSVDGTTNGTSTDIDGKYSLKVEPGTVRLKFSFVGYQTAVKEVTVIAGKTTTLDHSMEEEAALLNEMVVVGYGVQRKRDVTGNVVRIEGKKLTELPVNSFEAGIQGQAAGVSVTTGSGLAGASSLLRIRGISSISSAGDPLIIVDGIPITQNNFINESGGDRGGMNNNPLGFLNPNDIESLEILKDAAATGIYGARGANGVILITTKRGTEAKGKDKWTIGFNSRVSLSEPVATPNMLNSAEFLQLYQEAWENDGNTGLAALPGGISWEDARATDTDWVGELTQTGVKHSHNLELARATERITVFLSGGLDHNESYIKGSSADRMSSRLNLDYKVSEKLNVGTNLSISRYQVNRVDAAWSGGYGAAMSTALPIYPIRHLRDVYNENGELLYAEGDWFRGEGNVNPVADLAQKERRVVEYRGLSNLYAQYQPIKDLIFRLDARYEHVDTQDDAYEAPGLNKSRLDEQIGRAKKFPTWNNNYNFTLTANYLWAPTERHDFNFLVGKEYQDSWVRSYSRLEYQNLDSPLYDFEGTPLLTRKEKNSPTRHVFDSYFARVNYKLDDRYIFQATIRSDGSSRFGTNNKYGFFPSGSAGWILTEENFLKESKVFSFLKLKASVGLTGNSGIPDYQWFGEYGTGELGYGGQSYIFPLRRENPDLKWETSTNYDAAVEFGLFKDRISGDLSVYYKRTNDLLLSLQVPANTGFSSYWDNVGALFNQGVEFNLNTVNIAKGNFTWRTNFNIAYNYNEILSIGEYTEDAVSGGTNDTRVVVGSPVGTNFLVDFSHVDPETGRPVYIDIDGNETFSWDPKDRIPVGDILPDAVGGITNSFTYKRWDASILFYGSFGGKVYDSSSKRQLGVVTNWNMRTEIFDRWREEGDMSMFPRLTLETETYGTGTPWINTDLWLHDADYVRLRRLAVGYTIPKFKLKGKQIESVRFEASGSNLWIWTNFFGLDPEVVRDFEGQTDRNMSGNITYLTAPVERTFNLALNITL